ncbi:MAG: hypothetical protein WAN34_05475 [Acidimicrobiia bacterium]
MKWLVVLAAIVVSTGCRMADSEPLTTTTDTAGSPATETTQTTMGTTNSTNEPTEVFLLVEWPPQRLVVVTSDILIRGSATPGAIVRAAGVETTVEPVGYIVDGHSAAYFELPVSLEPGDADIEVSASDQTGAVATSDVTVTYLPAATEEFAFLTQVSASEIVADYAQWLTGEEANRAAVAAGDIPEGEEVPNGYYILNVNDRLRTLPLAESPVVVLPTSASGPVIDVNVGLDQWLSLFDEGKPWAEGESPGDDYFGSGSIWTPYWLTLADGVVVQIHQQYVP